jgi:hypothetical protein
MSQVHRPLEFVVDDAAPSAIGHPFAVKISLSFFLPRTIQSICRAIAQYLDSPPWFKVYTNPLCTASTYLPSSELSTQASSRSSRLSSSQPAMAPHFPFSVLAATKRTTNQSLKPASRAVFLFSNSCSNFPLSAPAPTSPSDSSHT